MAGATSVVPLALIEQPLGDFRRSSGAEIFYTRVSTCFGAAALLHLLLRQEHSGEASVP
jgi:hypothetical protein